MGPAVFAAGIRPGCFFIKSRSKALQNFIKYFEEDIEHVLRQDNYGLIKEEIIHFEMVRNYQRLVGKQ